jgi:hypothetical protein
MRSVLIELFDQLLMDFDIDWGRTFSDVKFIMLKRDFPST